MTRLYKRTAVIALLFALFTLLFVALPAAAQDTGSTVQPEPTFTKDDLRGYLLYAGYPYSVVQQASCMPAQEAGQYAWCLVPLDGNWYQWLIVWRTHD